jgi:hypothetical protein
LKSYELTQRQLTNLHEAGRVAEILIRAGHLVAGTDIYGHCPRIKVVYTPACARLGGHWSRFRSMGGRTVRHMVAPYHNCLIEWDEEETHGKRQAVETPVWEAGGMP